MIQHSFNSDSNDSGGSHRGAFSSAVPVHSMIQIGADQDMPASDLAHKEAKEGFWNNNLCIIIALN